MAVLQQVGWVAPLACAVHCLAGPGLALAGVGLGVPHAVEWAVMGVAVLVGGAALRSGRAVHGSVLPAVGAATGVAVWVAGEAIATAWVAAAGAVLLFAMLMWNLRLRSRACACPACDLVR